jgi:hypothetical protein
MGKYKSEKEDLQDFVGILFGDKGNMKSKAAQMRSNIYKGGLGLGVSVLALAVLLLNFTD